MAVTGKRFQDWCFGQHGVESGASVSLGVQEGGLSSAPAPGSPGELCCRPSRSLGVQLVCLVQGSGAYPVMRGSEFPTSL